MERLFRGQFQNPATIRKIADALGYELPEVAYRRVEVRSVAIEAVDGLVRRRVRDAVRALRLDADPSRGTSGHMATRQIIRSWKEAAELLSVSRDKLHTLRRRAHDRTGQTAWTKAEPAWRDLDALWDWYRELVRAAGGETCG